MKLKYMKNKEDYFFYLFNDLGYTDLCLFYNYQKKDELMWTKWIPYSTLMELDSHDHVPGTIDNKQSFIRKASHRTVLDIEVMLDLDDTMIQRCDMFTSIRQKAFWVHNTLKAEHKTPSTWHTGNRGYHITYLDPSLRGMSEYQRKLIKEKECLRFGSDLLKANSRVAIMLEGVRHRKSGNFKFEVGL